MPERFQQLNQWLRIQCNLPDFSIEPASGDASFRRYFRVTLAGGDTRIAMDAPPEQENCGPFVRVSEELQAIGVHVPKLLHQDLDQGFLLLEDLGDELFLPNLRADTVERLYGDALGALMMMQAAAPVGFLPPYDRELLETEMRLFPEWLLSTHLGITLDAAQWAQLDQLFGVLIENALSQPQVFVHRDYHSRNLMVCSDQNPGVIDFQDAVRGPVTYDLVSLLRDCYIEWPPEMVDGWALGYHQLCVQSGIFADDISPQQFLLWFDLMGVQRHLKAAGIFARLWHRDGKPGYLEDIPRTLGYIVQVAERRPELESLAGLIVRQVLPRLVRTD